jgi:HEAT repeat protein
MSTYQGDEHCGIPDAAAGNMRGTGGWRRRVRTNVRTMVALVVCCGLIFWALRVVWESQNPSVRAVKALDAADAARRLIAVRELQLAGPTAMRGAVLPLASRLGDADRDVRAAAAEALGTILAQPATANSPVPADARAAAAALLRALRDKAPSVRIAAAMSLWSIANSKQPELDFELAASTLAEGLGDPDPVVRVQVVYALGMIGPRGSDDPPPALVAALNDADVTLRGAAVGALSRYGRGMQRLVPALIRAVERDGPAAHAIYLEVLNSLRPRAHPPLPGLFEPEHVPTLIVALGSRDQAVRCIAASGLGAFGPAAISAVPALIETLRVSLHSPVEASTSALPRWVPRDAAEAAAGALGAVAPAAASMEAISALREALRSSRAVPRGAAAAALVRFGPTAAVALPDLIKALRETIATEEPGSDSATIGPSQFPLYTGFRIAEAIAVIGANTDSSEAAAVLAEALSAKSVWTREGAIYGLRSLAPRSASARARLTEALRHSDREVRAAAESILAKLKPANDR